MAARASLFQDHTAVAGAVRSLEWRESTAGSSPNRKRHSSDHAPAKRQVIRADELGLQHVAPGFDAADGLLSDAIVAGHRLNRNDLAVEYRWRYPGSAWMAAGLFVLAPVSLTMTRTVRAWITWPFAGVMMVSLAALPGRGEVEGPGGPLAVWPPPPHAAADKTTATATRENLTSLIAPPP